MDSTHIWLWRWRLLAKALAVVLAGTVFGAGCGDPSGGSSDTSSGDAAAVDISCTDAADGGCSCTYEGKTRGVCATAPYNSESGTCRKPEAYESSESRCSDGLDNDCDGKTDCADAECTGESCGLGQATATCTAGRCVEAACADGADNDQDGDTDCADPDCRGETCDRETGAECPAPADFEPDGESSCDEIDNDCDGTTDESCPCNYDPREPQNVDRNGDYGSGVCVDQKLDGMGVCQQPDAFESRTDSETCDGLDNDCDGAVDEGCPCGYQGTMEGVCANGERNTENGDCTVAPDHYQDDERRCDNIDNDCDGQTDENCDKDGDGYCDDDFECVSSADIDCTCGDCDDRDPDARPDQTEYFSSPRTSGGFDYDCDNFETRRFTKSGSCSTCGTTKGWTGNIPGCGQSADWLEQCSCRTAECRQCNKKIGQKTQECR